MPETKRPGLLLVVFEEVDDERVDVAGPLAQGRQLDGEDREAVEEVAAESALLDGARQIDVRRGDDAHVRACSTSLPPTRVNSPS